MTACPLQAVMGTIRLPGVPRGRCLGARVLRRPRRSPCRWRRSTAGAGSLRTVCRDHPLAAERLIDQARAVFDADVTENITLGYAATVHSAQGVTADSSYAVLGEGASRAMLVRGDDAGSEQQRGVPVSKVR